MEEIHSKMKRDGTGTFQLESMLRFKDIDDYLGVSCDNGKVINVDTYVLIDVAILPHPDVGFRL